MNIGGRLLDISSPLVMSIINVTPDSFYQGSRNETKEKIISSVRKALDDGSSIIDIGGYSTRPNAKDISPKEESQRVCEALKIIKKEFGDIFVSIDTFRSSVVKEAFDVYGAFIVNDITAGLHDKEMIDCVADRSLPYIAMHMVGTPQTMSNLNDYDNLMSDILKYFRERLEKIHEAGIKDVIIDPGFGFAKDTEQNFELLRHTSELSVLGKPILAGVSRKSMIWQTLNITPDEALSGTTVLGWELLRQGVNILRVHDTKEAVQTIQLFNKVRNSKI